MIQSKKCYSANFSFRTLSQLLVCLIIWLSITSCSDESTAPETDTNNQYWQRLSAGRYALQFFLDEFDDSNTVGVIELNSSLSVQLRQSPPGIGPLVEFRTEETKGTASTFDLAQKIRASLGNITVNGTTLSEYEPGGYQHLRLFNDPALELNFGSGQNDILIEGSEIFPRYEGSVTFKGAPMLSNITLGQKVSRSANLTITWNGAATDQAEIVLATYDPSTDPLDGEIRFFSKLVENSGETTIAAEEIQNLSKGLTDLVIRQFEVLPVSMPNGQVMYVAGVTSHALSVELVE